MGKRRAGVGIVLAIASILGIGSLGCGGGEEARDAGEPVDARAPDAGSARDASAPDGGTLDAGPGDGGEADAARPDGGPPPTGMLVPVPGEVTIVQAYLPIGLVPRLGEAAVLVGPDGTLVLMDVGNTNHADDVVAIVRELNTSWITPERGFPRRRGDLEVDWIVLSHFHADHVGGLFDLLDGPDAVDLVHAVVHRGLTDAGPALNEGHFERFCDEVRGPLVGREVALCESAEPAACAASARSDPHRAVACPGLFLGDLADPSDDPAGEVSRIALGAGAEMRFLGASAFVSDGSSAVAFSPFGHSESNEENGRSLIALVTHGPFRYHWGGDLTGSGTPGHPDVESHLAAVAADAFYGPLGVDVIHAHHHLRRTSSNATFVELTAPIDGRDRNVIGGVNAAYIGSPHAEVLAAWADDERLAGGYVWITRTAPTGADHPRLIDARSSVTLRTAAGGASYFVQAGEEPALAYASVR